MKFAISICVFVWTVLFMADARAQDVDFLSAIEDVPLMSGMSEAQEETVYFDTPGGRIVEAYAYGTVTKESLLSYYKESLPSLGWIEKNTGHFVREGEQLELSIRMDKKIATVRFALSPSAK